MKFTREKGFYQNFFRLYVALVLQNVIMLSVNLADNMMLGAYSEVSLSGVAAVNQVQFVYQQILMAFGDGMVIFGSQYWGKKQIEPMKKIAAAAMRAGLIAAVILFAAASVWPYKMVGLFTTDVMIIEEGVSYLRILKFSYVFFAVTVLLLATLRSVEIVKAALYLSLMTFTINCGINYVLIYGNFHAPELGAEGAAIGTLTARIIECAVIVWYVGKKENYLRLKLSDYAKLDKVLCRDYFKITLPMLFVQGLWGLNTALQTAILGHMTAAAIAANSMASTLFLMVKSMAVGAASTASVIIGKAIGMGNLIKVKEYAKTLQVMFLGIGILSGMLLFLLKNPVLACYDLSAETKQMADTFLIILCVVCVGMSYQMPVNNGIIRGGGNAIFVVRMDIISIWCIVLPLSFIMAFVVKASPVVVVCCLNADQIFKCIPAFLEVNFGKWIRKLTRE